MRQLLKRTLVLVPLLALLAVPAPSFGQSGRSWSERFDTIPASRMPDGNPAWWNTIIPMQAWVLQDWANKAAATSKWHTDEDCQAAMEYARAALDSADIQAGLGTGSLVGEYFGDEDVIVVSLWQAQGGVGFGTLIHESWHRSTGEDDADITALNAKLDSLYNGRTLESCHDEAREEEDDEDDPGGGEDPTEGSNCDEKQVWVEPVTRWEFVKPPSTQGTRRSLPGVPGVEPVPLTGITISEESKGEWVEVVIEDGYWKTVTVCED